jgi:hypothetical protein
MTLVPSYRTDWKAGKGSGALLLLSINPVWTVMWSGGALHHADSIECIKNLEVQVIPRLSGIPTSYGFSSPSGQPAPDFFMPCNSRHILGAEHLRTFTVFQLLSPSLSGHRSTFLPLPGFQR